MKKLLILLLLSSLLFVGCEKNVTVYETFDDGNCGELGYCSPPEEYK